METIPWYLNWAIPNTDPAIDYAIKEALRWVAENVITLVVITNALTYLKILAIRNNRVKDDKILTWLIGFFTFKWLRGLTTPIPPPVPPVVGAGTKGNPIVLTEVVEEDPKLTEIKEEQKAWMDIRLKEIEKAAQAQPGSGYQPDLGLADSSKQEASPPKTR